MDKLNKYIRPIGLILILISYFTFAILSAFGININQSYVELLGQWGIVVMSTYYGGKSFERVASIKSQPKENTNGN